MQVARSVALVVGYSGYLQTMQGSIPREEQDSDEYPLVPESANTQLQPSVYKIIVLLVKICIQTASIYIRIFSRFNVSFRAESLEKIHLKKWMSERKTLLFFFFFYRIPLLQHNDYMHNQISLL